MPQYRPRMEIAVHKRRCFYRLSDLRFSVFLLVLSVLPFCYSLCLSLLQTFFLTVFLLPFFPFALSLLLRSRLIIVVSLRQLVSLYACVSPTHTFIQRDKQYLFIVRYISRLSICDEVGLARNVGSYD